MAVNGVRTLISTLLAIATCVATVAAIGSTWMRHQLLDSATWTSASVTVLRDPAVQAITADFLASEVVASAQQPAVAAQLPPQLQALSRDAATNLAHDAALRGLRSGNYEPLWRTAMRGTHRQFVRWLNGADDRSARNATVSLDLQPSIVRLARQIGVPDAAIQTAVASSEAAEVPLIGRGQYAQTRDDAHRLQQISGLALPLAVVLALVSVAITPRRRSGLIRVALAIAVGGLIALGLASAVRTHFEHGLVDGGSSPAVAAAIWHATAPELLRDAWLATVAGAIVAILAVATRPGRVTAQAR